MTNRITFLVLICMFGGLPLCSNAQFINLQFRVEPELSATVEQSLDFGTQIANSGRTYIDLGDVNMGIFSVKAFRTQNVFLSLTFPEFLTNSTIDSNHQIPLELSIAYNNSGTNNYENAQTLNANNGLVSIHENTSENAQEVWQELFIYVFGSIEIGAVANGVYTGEIILSIDYN